MSHPTAVCLVAALFIALSSAMAQQNSGASVPTASVVPRLVSYGGMLSDGNGKPIGSITGVTFLIYRDAQGGSPLWLETQNVTPDKNGRYTVQLGAMHSDGLPADIFLSGEARWLALQVTGEAEQPRVLLLAVPYAMKAADAETVGGLPPSAFVLATPAISSPAVVSSDSPMNSGSPSNVPPPASTVTTAGGTLNTLPLWTTSTNIQSSVISQTGTGSTAKIGIGTATPGAALDVKGTANIQGLLTSPASGAATSTSGKASQPHAFVASSFSSSTLAAVNQTFQWKAEAVGNNTATPSGTLNLLFASGTTVPAETGLRLSNKGIFTFASGQTFPGTGTLTGVTTAIGGGLIGGGKSGTLTLSLLNTCTANQILQWNGTSWICANAGGTGTITGVTAGTDLTGGGKSGSITLNLDTTKVPQLASSNTFGAAQAITSNASSADALTITNNGNGAGINIATTNGTAVFANASGIGTTGIFGSGGLGGIGVNGFSTNSTGVFGNSTTGNGVAGQTGGSTVGTAGVYGVAGTASTVGGGIAGVWGTSVVNVGVFGNSTNQAGVVGSSGNGYGVWGTSAGNDAIHGDTSATNFGGVGGISASAGYGVKGLALANNGQGYGTGVRGESNGTQSFPDGSGSDGVDGFAHSNNGSGVAGINTSGGPGISAYSATGWGLLSYSNVSQSRTTGGWVKAMAYVDPFASGGIAVTQCFNSQQTGAAVSTPPCGISITHLGQGQNLLDFGFEVDDRFVLLTNAGSSGSVIHSAVCSLCTSVNQKQVFSYDVQAANRADDAFFIVVF